MDPRQAFTSPRQGQSEVQAHMALNTFTEQENAKKQQAAMQEAAYYEQLNMEADEMLAPDRKRFDDMVGRMQGSIREKIAMYGGNRQDFLQNGGHKILQNFSSSIKNTPEFESYINNKQNYVKIKDAMERGMKHRITLRDQKALENYEANGSGNITYSGLMSEIEMPPSSSYNLGENIPMTDILYHGDNYMKVVGNYMANFPDDKNFGPENLVAFMQMTGYGQQKGSNRDLLNEQRAARLAAAKDPKVTEDTRPQLFTTNLQKVLEAVPRNTQVNNLFDTELGSYEPKKLIENMMKQGNTFLSDNIAGRWKPTSHAVNENEAGFDISFEKFGSNALSKAFGDRWRVAEAQEIAPEKKTTMASYTLSLEPDESGDYKLDPSQISEMFGPTGVELVGSNNLEAGVYEGSYKNLGVLTGAYVMGENGARQMVMQVENSKGEIQVDEQKEHVEGLRNGAVSMGYFVALQNKDNGRIYYKRMNMEDTNFVAGLSSKIGSSDDLRNQNDSNQRLEGDLQAAEQSANTAEENYDRELLLIDEKAVNSPAFQEESKRYANPDNINDNRSSLIKSFYAISGTDVGSLSFHEMMKIAPETAKLMGTYGHGTSDAELVDIFVSEISQGEDEATIASNREMGRQWKNAYNRYTKIKR